MRTEERNQAVKKMEVKIANFQRKLQLIDKDLTVELGLRGEVLGLLNPVVKYKDTEILEAIKFYGIEQPRLFVGFDNIPLDKAGVYANAMIMFGKFMGENKEYWKDY